MITAWLVGKEMHLDGLIELTRWDDCKGQDCCPQIHDDVKHNGNSC
jgi:hypothetical protein